MHAGSDYHHAPPSTAQLQHDYLNHIVMRSQGFRSITTLNAYEREMMHAAHELNGPTFAHGILTTAELVATLAEVKGGQR
jgi:hypothetical protein